jgi:hypothetical protein
VQCGKLHAALRKLSRFGRNNVTNGGLSPQFRASATDNLKSARGKSATLDHTRISMVGALWLCYTRARKPASTYRPAWCARCDLCGECTKGNLNLPFALFSIPR